MEIYMQPEILEELLSCVSGTATADAQALMAHFENFLAVSEADQYSLLDVLGGNMSTSLYIKLAVALSSRRICDEFKFGKTHTDEEIKRYLTALFFGIGNETVYVLSFDNDGRVIACDRAGEGTVNFSSVLPRKIMEIIKRRGAKSVIVAHNHPGGYATPSQDDVLATKLVREVFTAYGIKLIKSLVVAGCDVEEINTD